MEKLESMLTEIFDSRVDSVASVTPEEKEEIRKMKNYVDLEEFFPDASKKEIEKIEEFADIVTENMASEMGFFNEKYYKIGFADAVKLIMECMGKWIIKVRRWHKVIFLLYIGKKLSGNIEFLKLIW